LMNYVMIGQGATVKISAKLYDYVYIGAFSKVGGEVESSIIERYANKQHEGFLGHSYISSWCNLGADTNTSDLKNNYSTIRMNVGGKEIDTKMQFLGLIMGEHSKCGINTMFNTGTVVGMSSNIFGAGFPPKTIGSFQWGGAEGFVRYDLDKALEVARTVMKRRNVQLTPEYETLFRAAYTQELC
ncbi:MAG: transferase, partial [Candidatus Thermochlorobacter sp.]